MAGQSAPEIAAARTVFLPLSRSLRQTSKERPNAPDAFEVNTSFLPSVDKEGQPSEAAPSVSGRKSPPISPPFALIRSPQILSCATWLAKTMRGCPEGPDAMEG